MQHPPHLSPEQQVQRVTFIGVLAIAEPLGTFASWCITGVAAILGLLIANLDSVSKIISHGGIRWGMVFLASSMVFGALVKQLGIALTKAVEMIEGMYAEFGTPEGKAMLSGLNPDFDFSTAISAPFLPPLRWFMKRSANNGAKDYLQGEKTYVKMFCVQIYCAWLQQGCALAGILVLAFGTSGHSAFDGYV